MVQRSVTWKGMSFLGTAILGCGLLSLALGFEDFASALFVAGIIEIVVGLVLLAFGRGRSKASSA